MWWSIESLRGIDQHFRDVLDHIGQVLEPLTAPEAEVREVLLRILPVNACDQFLADRSVHCRVIARIRLDQPCHRLVAAVFVQSAKITLHDTLGHVGVLDQETRCLSQGVLP